MSTTRQDQIQEALRAVKLRRTNKPRVANDLARYAVPGDASNARAHGKGHLRKRLPRATNNLEVGYGFDEEYRTEKAVRKQQPLSKIKDYSLYDDLRPGLKLSSPDSSGVTYERTSANHGFTGQLGAEFGDSDIALCKLVLLSYLTELTHGHASIACGANVSALAGLALVPSAARATRGSLAAVAAQHHNLTEATIVTRLVLAIKAAGFAEEDIAVLTGYSAQVKVLTREGNQNAWSSVRIPDVHSSQGSEAKFLIISLVSKKGRATLVGNRSRVKAESKKRNAHGEQQDQDDEEITEVAKKENYIPDVFDRVILNKAQKAKSDYTLTHRSIATLRAKQVNLLTATPMIDRPLDLLGRNH
ncbi:MAG: hypothetical protein OHK93_002439 [Ramalina farinacea]|uniref:DNA2/NAM7 helicase-like C-terminal domain-containing protein n=1 Tax=Ramalina farinacea TaxID=258253 RepID=A0AA43QRJ6_9LECA|nr:hypothetical protein [Ramalina farinacea]